MLNTYKTCIKGTIWFLKRVIEEINLLDLHLSVLANTLFSELGNALNIPQKRGTITKAHAVTYRINPLT